MRLIIIQRNKYASRIPHLQIKLGLPVTPVMQETVNYMRRDLRKAIDELMMEMQKTADGSRGLLVQTTKLRAQVMGPQQAPHHLPYHPSTNAVKNDVKKHTQPSIGVGDHSTGQFPASSMTGDVATAHYKCGH